MAEPDRDSLAAGHELRDVNVKYILRFIAALAIFGVVVLVFVRFLLEAFVARYDAAQPKLPPLVAKERTEFPAGVDRIPRPRLQISDIADMEALRKKNMALQHSYGWVDREHGIVRIPIEQAIKLIAEQGLPLRKE